MESIQLSHHDKGVYKKDLSCKDCKAKNLSDFWHCFKCCAEGHTARLCPKKAGKLVTVTGDGDNQVTGSHHKTQRYIDFVKMQNAYSANVNSQGTGTNYVSRTTNVIITSIERGEGERGKCRVYRNEGSIYVR